MNESILSELDVNHVYNTSLSKLDAEGFTLSNLHVRIIKYETKLDLEISFDLTKQVLLSDSQLCSFFSNLAQVHQVPMVYGGLEHAEDEETRIFTGSAIGPMALDRFK